MAGSGASTNWGSAADMDRSSHIAICKSTRFEWPDTASATLGFGLTNRFAQDKYGAATTQWRKLEDRVKRGVGNPCPLRLIGLPSSVVSFAVTLVIAYAALKLWDEPMRKRLMGLYKTRGTLARSQAAAK